MTRSFFIVAALLSCLVLKAGPDLDSLEVEVRQDTLREAKITSDRAVTVARTQTGHKRLDNLDFIYGNVCR